MTRYQVDRERWAQMTIFEQMGNIGSEVGRAIRAKQLHDEQRFNGALCRGLDLFEATTEVLIAKKSGRVREVLIARDQFLQLFFGKAPENDAQKIEEYFMQYAIAARLHR